MVIMNDGDEINKWYTETNTASKPTQEEIQDMKFVRKMLRKNLI